MINVNDTESGSGAAEACQPIGLGGGGSQILGQSGRKMVARGGGNLHMGGRGLMEGEPVLEGGDVQSKSAVFVAAENSGD